MIKIMKCSNCGDTRFRRVLEDCITITKEEDMLIDDLDYTSQDRLYCRGCDLELNEETDLVEVQQ